MGTDWAAVTGEDTVPAGVVGPLGWGSGGPSQSSGLGMEGGGWQDPPGGHRARPCCTSSASHRSSDGSCGRGCSCSCRARRAVGEGRVSSRPLLPQGSQSFACSRPRPRVFPSSPSQNNVAGKPCNVPPLYNLGAGTQVSSRCLLSHTGIESWEWGRDHSTRGSRFPGNGTINRLSVLDSQ